MSFIARDEKRGFNVINVREREEAKSEPGALDIVKGLGVTFGRMVKTITRIDAPNISYPEVKRQYSGRFRGVHILTQRENGTPKCVACFLCATACPADCIYIEAAESPDPQIEKFPKVFDIDMLRCVFCGYCVDACPEEAIIMSREHEIASFDRKDFIYHKEQLMHRPEIKLHGLGYRPRE